MHRWTPTGRWGPPSTTFHVRWSVAHESLCRRTPVHGCTCIDTHMFAHVCVSCVARGRSSHRTAVYTALTAVLPRVATWSPCSTSLAQTSPSSCCCSPTCSSVSSSTASRCGSHCTAFTLHRGTGTVRGWHTTVLPVAVAVARAAQLWCGCVPHTCCVVVGVLSLLHRCRGPQNMEDEKNKDKKEMLMQRRIKRFQRIQGVVYVAWCGRGVVVAWLWLGCQCHCMTWFAWRTLQALRLPSPSHHPSPPFSLQPQAPHHALHSRVGGQAPS